jgi:hypothetical protein
MSQENAALVDRALAAWNSRDIEAMLALTDPGVLSDARWELDRLYERGDEIVGLGPISRRMPGSDARIEDRVLIAVRFENGRITRMEVLGFGQAEVQTALGAVGRSGTGPLQKGNAHRGATSRWRRGGSRAVSPAGAPSRAC